MQKWYIGILVSLLLWILSFLFHFFTLKFIESKKKNKTKTPPPRIQQAAMISTNSRIALTPSSKQPAFIKSETTSFAYKQW